MFRRNLLKFGVAKSECPMRVTIDISGVDKLTGTLRKFVVSDCHDELEIIHNSCLGGHLFQGEGGS